MTIFHKDTDRNIILHTQNYRLKRMITNIPFGQFVRLKQLCTKESYTLYIESKAKEIWMCFTAHGYDNKTLDEAVNKGIKLQNSSYTLPRQHQIIELYQNILVFGEIKNFMKRHWKVLKCNQSLKHVFLTSLLL